MFCASPPITLLTGSPGGFSFWLGNYKDMLFDLKANDEAFKFWRKKTPEIVTDPRKREILVPEEAPHPFGTSWCLRGVAGAIALLADRIRRATVLERRLFRDPQRPEERRG